MKHLLCTKRDQGRTTHLFHFHSLPRLKQLGKTDCTFIPPAPQAIRLAQHNTALESSRR
ncbi:Uncharacterised protein [Vibrio cholerae]|nr:Uncharacterised protein [Vibrio cholerae]